MNSSSKEASTASQENVLRGAYNDQDKTISVGPFVSAKAGHKIIRAVIDVTTDDYSFYDGATLLYTLRVIYDNASHDNVNSVERTV